jgi:hypothetical protein
MTESNSQTYEEGVRTGTTPFESANPEKRGDDALSDSIDSADKAMEEEYPTGMRLVPVIVAIVLGVFLVALDQTIIGKSQVPLSTSARSRAVLTRKQELQSPKSQTTSAASTRCRGMVRPSS